MTTNWSMLQMWRKTHRYTRNGETSGSLIHFFMTKAGLADRLETATDVATTSDHGIVCAHSRWDEGEAAKVSTKITGWDIEGLKEEEELYKKAKKQWEERSLNRPVLIEESAGEQLQEEAECVQRNCVNHLNRHCKQIKVCARSKRWWTQEIAETRKILGPIKRSRNRGEGTQPQVRMQRSSLRRMIQQSMKKM
jgi:hypothetical protein